MVSDSQPPNPSDNTPATSVEPVTAVPTMLTQLPVEQAVEKPPAAANDEQTAQKSPAIAEDKSPDPIATAEPTSTAPEPVTEPNSVDSALQAAGKVPGIAPYRPMTLAQEPENGADKMFDTQDDKPTLNLNKAEKAEFLAMVQAQQAQRITCPKCGLQNLKDSVTCARCNSPLTQDMETTAYLGPIAPDTPPGAWPVGEVIVTDDAPVIFEIEGVPVRMPVADVITVGRHNPESDLKIPHVDLTAQRGYEKGVSRKHIRLHRKNMLVYVVDLGSANGTLLNGRRLIANSERLLRDGDELQLGKLKMKVKLQN
jgi:hypothetical protein